VPELKAMIAARGGNTVSDMGELMQKDTDVGEQPEAKLYLVMQVFAVEPTTLEENGHKLGVIARVIVSYCAACVAGMGGCIHCSMGCWGQYHCWGKNTGIERPVTMSLCRWDKSNTRRKFQATNPIHMQQLAQMPMGLELAKKKVASMSWSNTTEGLDARYSVYSSDEKKKRAMDRARFSHERPTMKAFLELLRS